MEKLELKGTQQFLGMDIPIMEGGFGKDQRVMLAKDIAIIHGVETKYINKLINNNIQRFNENDLINLKTDSSEEIIKFIQNNNLIGSNRTKHVYLLSESGYLKLISLFKDKNENLINVVLTKIFNSNKQVIPITNNKEVQFRKILSDILSEFNISCIFQYAVLNYRIDIYIPSLNIAIEYDENEHKDYTYEQQEGRQLNIEKELHCKFIRVSDKYSINIAVGKVLKQIYDIKKEILK